MPNDPKSLKPLTEGVVKGNKTKPQQPIDKSKISPPPAPKPKSKKE